MYVDHKKNEEDARKTLIRIGADLDPARLIDSLSLNQKQFVELARELVDNEKVAERISRCSEQLQAGEGYYQSMKDTGLFSGFYIQMIKVGSRSGHLDRVMEEISGDYEEAADASIDNMIARFEPTIVAVLAVSVGLVLLSVMLPLVGVLSAIG